MRRFLSKTNSEYERCIKINALCMLLPIIFMSIGLFDLGFLPTLASMIILACLFLYNVKKKTDDHNIKIVRKLFIAIFVASIYMLIMTLFGYKDGISTAVSIIILMLLTFINIVFSPDSKKTFMLFLRYFTVFVELLIIYSLFVRLFGNQYISRMNDTLWIQTIDIGQIRLFQSASGDSVLGFGVGSITNNPNCLSYLSIFACTIILFIQKQKNRHLKTVVFLTGVLISGSRLAISMSVGLLCLVVPLKIYMNNKKAGIMAFAILFLVLFICSIVLIWADFDLIGNLNLNGRETMWRVGVDNISFLGGGSGYDSALINNLTNVKLSMHNAYISMLVNYGIVFAAGFLGFVFYAILCARHIGEMDIRAIVMCLLIELCVIGLSEAAFLYVNIFGYLFNYLSFSAVLFLCYRQNNLLGFGVKNDY